jgi:hypothetical protein
MSNPIRFQDHTAFHVQVLRVTLAAAAVSTVFYVVGLLVALNSRFSEVFLSSCVVAVLGIAANPPRREKAVAVGLVALGVGLLATLARLALSGSPGGYPWFGVGVSGLAVGILAGRDLQDFRRYVLPLGTAVTMALGTWVTGAFRDGVNFAAYVPPAVAEPMYGALFGFLVSIGLIVRQITVERDLVADTYDKVRPTLTGEMRDLSDRAVALYGRIKQVLRDRREKGAQTDALGQVVRSLVLKVVHLGPRWNEVEREVGRTNPGDLAARIEGLERKIAETADDVARKQYRMAREALGGQLRYLQDIGTSRERVIARVHNYLATLERLHLAVLNHRGADAAKFSDEIQPILEEIDGLGHEMDFASDAIREAAEASDADAAEEKPPVSSVLAATATAEGAEKDPEAQLAASTFEN